MGVWDIPIFHPARTMEWVPIPPLWSPNCESSAADSAVAQLRQAPSLQQLWGTEAVSCTLPRGQLGSEVSIRAANIVIANWEASSIVVMRTACGSMPWCQYSAVGSEAWWGKRYLTSKGSRWLRVWRRWESQGRSGCWYKSSWAFLLLSRSSRPHRLEDLPNS